MTSGFQLPKFYGTGRSDSDREIARAARKHTAAPRIPFDRFISRLSWGPGEHVAIIGPTGAGKTNTIINLLPLHPFVVVCATKPRDITMDRLISVGGYEKMERWRSEDPRVSPRRVLWPDATKLDSDVTQKEAFSDAMGRIYREGGWTFVIDELWFFINALGLDREVKRYLLQARSLGISLVAATQRPFSVPVEVYDQSTHLFFFRDNDRRNLDRLADINAVSSGAVRELVAGLDRHQLLYINTRTGEMCRTTPPLVKIGGE